MYIYLHIYIYIWLVSSSNSGSDPVDSEALTEGVYLRRVER